MATHLSSITGIGSSAKKLAALLQKKAPPGEKLAFINDREAALLKRHGGSGKEVEDTGINSYADGSVDEYSMPSNLGESSFSPINESFAVSEAGPQTGGGVSNAPVETGGGYSGQGFKPASSAASSFDLVGSTPDFGVKPNVAAPGVTSPTGFDVSGGITAPSAPTFDITTRGAGQQALVQGDTTTDQTKPGVFGSAAKALGLTSDQLGRGLGGGLQALLAANQMRQARAQGQQAKQETQALAAPYQQQGQQLQAQAASGTLTPANQQALQAAQAQLAQQVQARGGVGAAQMQTQIACLLYTSTSPRD